MHAGAGRGAAQGRQARCALHTRPCDNKNVRAQRHECKDFISLFACDGWRPLAHMSVGTADLEGLAFSPSSTCIAAWDSPLSYCVVVLALDGSVLAHFGAYEGALGVKCASFSPEGQLLAIGSYDQVRQRAGGSQSLRLCMRFAQAPLMPGVRMKEVRLLDHASWLPVASLAHPEHVSAGADSLVYYCEVAEPGAAPPVAARAEHAGGRAGGAALRLTAGAGREAAQAGGKCGPRKAAASEAQQGPTQFVVCGLPCSLPTLRVAADKPYRIGIGVPCCCPLCWLCLSLAQMLGSSDGSPQAKRCGALMASSWRRATTRSPSACGCGARRALSWLRWCSRCGRLHAADLLQALRQPAAPAPSPESPALTRSTLCQLDVVHDMAWHPREARLAIVCGGARLYVWSADGASSVLIPLPHFQAAAVSWNPTGTSVVLTDSLSSTFCCAFVA